jgi:hypothetical protein
MNMLKVAMACALGAALSILGTLGFAEDALPPHQGSAPIRNWHDYHPTHIELKALHDVTPNRPQEVNRSYNRLQRSTTAHWQSAGNTVENDGEADQNRLAKLIDEENRLLDRELQSICRGC